MAHSIPPFTVTVWFAVHPETIGLEEEMNRVAGAEPYSAFEYQGMRDMHWGADTEADARQLAERLKPFVENPHVVVLNLRGSPRGFEPVTYKDERPSQRKTLGGARSRQHRGEGLELHDLSRPLTEEEFDDLNEFLLSDATPDLCLDVSSLDGFLTALAVGPEALPPSRWLPVVWGETGGEEMVWESQDQAQHILGLIMRLMNEIADGFHQSPPYVDPIFYTRVVDEEEIIVIDEWCHGFMRGVGVSVKEWEP